MSGRVLFDTSVIIDSAGVRLGSFSDAEPVVSAVTVAELAYGLDTRDPIERHNRLERYHAVLDRMAVLAFDKPAATFYGTLAALVRQSGRDPRPRRMDLQIAATAVAHRIPVVTRNGKDFAGLERLLQVIAV
ncbi:type II toxin-antitoxin system VapC family toxin [Amycolatopsis nigrescens]|uniref:type II toxin-antitoxin system VapC family toxin n=1 Tax=Amycolatopsis nigrescens TaxID=381445 RepID=UPI00035C29FD|nr:type II toxin-antitoxin system VapC family toxin [Amycolatopsis nigrescens]